MNAMVSDHSQMALNVAAGIESLRLYFVWFKVLIVMR